MKRPVKITLITISSILGALIIAIIIICNIIFCPKTITPIIRNNIDIFVSCPVNVDTVDLSFFSTFPDFTLNLHNVEIINPTKGAQSDTLAKVEHLSAAVNIKEFLFNNKLIINEVGLRNASANLYVDSLGKTNFDIIKTTSEEDTTTTTLFDLLSLKNASIDNLSASYVDETMGIDVRLFDLNATAEGQLQGANGDILSNIIINEVQAHYNDSTNLFARLGNIHFDAEGNLRDNHFVGDVNLDLPKTTFALNNDTLAKELPIMIQLPAEVNFDIMHFNLKNALIAIAENKINLNGIAQVDHDVNLDIKYATNNWIIGNIIKLIPDSYQDLIKDIKADGIFSLNGSVCGTYNDSIMPVITANLNLNNGTASYKGIPHKLSNINTSLSASLNLNDKKESSATIHSLSAKTDFAAIKASGKIKDLLDKMKCSINLHGDANLPNLMQFIPKDLNVNLKGKTKADIKADFELADIMNMNIERIHADGSIQYTNLDVTYDDNFSIKDRQGVLSVKLPSPNKNNHFKELAQASLNATNISLNSGDINLANLAKPNITVGIGEFRDKSRAYSASAHLDLSELKFGISDTMKIDIQKPSIDVNLFPSRKNKKNPSIMVSYSNESLDANMGSFLKADTKHLNMHGSMEYHDNADDLLSQLKPNLVVDFNDGYIDMASIGTPIVIPAIKFKFHPNNFDIQDSRIIIKDSDFGLSGNITNLNDFINQEGLLKATLNFTSNETNIDQLMDLVNGFGRSDMPEEESASVDDKDEKSSDASEPNPFMVPKGVDVSLNTHIKKALFSGNKIENVGGRVTVKDGVIVLEQMGFTTDAAEMQLTGMYRSDRKNHLFCGIDFHLLNIDIKELINMIPSVDTIVPMLKTFDGKAQFHIAAETYLKANYEPKLSTLRAAAAIEGKDLVLLDNETFSTIAKYMMFSKKTKNIVDSMSVEMTVFRDEIDIYPFAISMDKWQAVLSGRHNMDMSFDYHISLTKCPLPVRLGLEIKGTMDKLKFKLVPCKYKYLYKPEKQRVTDKQTLALKKLISESLKANVK